jgi:hypothetical protein
MACFTLHPANPNPDVSSMVPIRGTARTHIKHSAVMLAKAGIQ